MIDYTLRDYCNKNNINYSLIEITGQNKQELEIRIQQTYLILKYLFKYFNYIL